VGRRQWRGSDGSQGDGSGRGHSSADHHRRDRRFATGRFTTPKEVASAITFLASSRAGNITGVSYIIDGGLIKTT
jgi:NAD(P)-dependent dehydrogenase (short-subunit alcohol dehydrogenase family)